MGLIHTRASKKRDKAAAKLLKTERKDLQKDQRKTAAQELEDKRKERAALVEPHVQAALEGDYPKWKFTAQEWAAYRKAVKDAES